MSIVRVVITLAGVMASLAAVAADGKSPVSASMSATNRSASAAEVSNTVRSRSDASGFRVSGLASQAKNVNLGGGHAQTVSANAFRVVPTQGSSERFAMRPSMNASALNVSANALSSVQGVSGNASQSYSKQSIK